MKTRSFASRKFLLCSTALVFGLAGYIYALIYQTDQFATVCTFIVSVLGVYGGANLLDARIGNGAAPTEAVPSKEFKNGQPGD